MGELIHRKLSFPASTKVELTPTALNVLQELTDEELDHAWEFLGNADSGIMWWIGDLAQYEEGKKNVSSEWYDNVEEKTGFKRGTIQQAVFTSKRIDSLIRIKDLGWSKHQIIAGAFDIPSEQAEWLQKAVDNKWSTRTLKNEINKAKPSVPLPKGKYEVIYADPPWAYNTEQSSKEVNEHYPTMELEDICAKPVQDLAWDNCVLYLWATTGRLDWAFPVLEAWGFKYLTTMVWDKVEHNLGWYCAANHEILIIGGRGNTAPQDIKLANSIDSVQIIPRSKIHSRKPQEFRKIIERLYPNKKKIELFAREKNPGWDVWGNEI